MKGKISSMIAIFMLGVLALTGIASALPTVDYIKIDGDKHESGDKLVVELGQGIDIKVKLQANAGDEDNIEVEADILGYEYNDHVEISDSTHTFDMDGNDTMYKTLSVSIPGNAEKDEYDLRIRIAGRTGIAFEGLYLLKVDGTRHNVIIKDIVLSPENEVKAGRALLATLRIKNSGEKDEESIKIKISIPELGLSASDYIDELEDGESTTSEELYLRIPSCNEEGTYKVVAEVEYDEGYERVQKETTIRVVEDEVCETSESPSEQQKPTTSQTIISVGSTQQDVPQGEGGVIYPLTITNAGSTSKTFILSVEGADEWATTRISPANTVVLGAGEMKAAYLYVSANEDATVGEHMFTVTIKVDSSVLKQIPFTANIVQPESNGNWDQLKKGLMTGLVIIVVLLVILGLIIGFNKLKGGDESEDEETEDGKTYY